MPTVIDSLVLEIGIDPSKFTKGQQEALGKLRQFEDQAKRSGNEVERNTNKAAESLSMLRGEALKLGAVAIGGGGIAAFVTGLTNTAQALGFLANITGDSVEKLSEWRNAARLGGGSAEGMTAFIAGLNKELNIFQLTGSSQVIPLLRQLNINPFKEGTNELKTMDALLKEIVHNAQLNQASRGTASAFLGMLGMDADTINVMLQGEQAVERYLQRARELGVVTKENAADARAANEAWSELRLTLDNAGNSTLILLHRGLRELKSLWDGGFQIAPGGLNFIQPGSPLDRFLALLGGPKSARSIGGGAVGSGAGGAGGGGGGDTPSGLAAMVASLRAQGFRITSTTGGTHSGGAHGAGLAVDFVPDGGSIPGEAARLRGKLAKMGIDATVLDASKPDSASWTGPHVHVQFNSPAAAARYAEMSRGEGGGGDSSRREVNIGNINIHTSEASAEGIAAGIGAALRATDIAVNANYGPSK